MGIYTPVWGCNLAFTRLFGRFFYCVSSITQFRVRLLRLLRLWSISSDTTIPRDPQATVVTPIVILLEQRRRQQQSRSPHALPPARCRCALPARTMAPVTHRCPSSEGPRHRKTSRRCWRARSSRCTLQPSGRGAVTPMHRHRHCPRPPHPPRPVQTPRPRRNSCWSLTPTRGPASRCARP